MAIPETLRARTEILTPEQKAWETITEFGILAGLIANEAEQELDFSQAINMTFITKTEGAYHVLLRIEREVQQVGDLNQLRINPLGRKGIHLFFREGEDGDQDKIFIFSTEGGRLSKVHHLFKSILGGKKANDQRFKELDQLTKITTRQVEEIRLSGMSKQNNLGGVDIIVEENRAQDLINQAKKILPFKAQQRMTGRRGERLRTM
jgi:hypothetical protein